VPLKEQLNPLLTALFKLSKEALRLRRKEGNKEGNNSVKAVCSSSNNSAASTSRSCSLSSSKCWRRCSNSRRKCSRKARRKRQERSTRRRLAARRCRRPSVVAAVALFLLCTHSQVSSGISEGSMKLLALALTVMLSSAR
jgi:hypothetical protein